MEVAISVIAKTAEYAVGPIGRQLSYIIFYRKHMNKLIDVTKDVEEQVEKAKSDSCGIRENVNSWLDRAKTIIESEANKISPNCLNLIQRHQLGRKAKKMAEEIKEIIENGEKLGVIGSPLPLEANDNLSTSGYKIIPSRTSIAKDIKDALAGTEVSMVGMYGMGGVGKTMLVKEIQRLVKEEKLFDKVIIATIGKSIDVKSIQAKFADFLRFTFKQESVELRAAFLQNKLQMEKKILIVLDDMWGRLDLGSVGIPRGCKILIVSRDRNILTNEMDVKICFEVEPLSKEESWEFFKTMIGEQLNETCIEAVAKDVAKECAGLPLAFDIVARALKGKDVAIWKDVLHQLGNPPAVNINGVSDKVYSSLKSSYDFVQSEEARLVFLLCSVFPDDYNIPFESLCMYVMGMRLLGVNTWEQTRSRMAQLVDTLKTSSLLLQSINEYVKMHDVIRDVAIYISSTEGKMSTLSRGNEVSEWKEDDRGGSYRAIFANCHGFDSLPEDLKFPELELLILSTIYATEKHQISDTFFEGMEKLKVLDLSWMCFPRQTTSLRNLQTLCMLHCEFEDMEIISELKKLQVLRMVYCPVRELPSSMSQLTQLKVLEVSNCFNLDVIHPNVISSMKELEMLGLLNFKRWGDKVRNNDKEIQNASLTELNCLHNLTCLRLNIPHLNTLSDRSLLKLESFHITLGDYWRAEESKHVEKYLNLQIQSKTDDVNTILLQSCHELSLRAPVGITNLLFKSNQKGYPHLKHLSLGENSDMQHLISRQHGNASSNYFSSLDTLVLDTMKSLENIVHMHVGPNPFNKLTLINLSYCQQLRNLFSFSIFQAFSNLQQIQVSHCDIMNGLVSIENEEASTIKTYHSRITSLMLTHVPQLTRFCSTQLTHQHQQNLSPFFDDQVAFPELEKLELIGASKLKMLCQNNGMIANSFNKLQSIEINECSNLRYVFPHGVITTLVSLDEIKIEGCELVEGIFEMEKLYIERQNDAAIDKLPKLRSVLVKGCPRLKSIFPASIKRLQQLEILDIDGQHQLFSEDKTSEITQSELSVFPQGVFPNLKDLSISCKTMTRSFEQAEFLGSKLFPNLKYLSLVGSNDDDWITLARGFTQIWYGLEELEIINNMSMVNPGSFCLWKFSVPPFLMSFPNLKSLFIDGCHGLMTLLNYSVVESLVKLERMRIHNCYGMLSVLEDSYQKEEETIFNKLVELELVNLPNLESFHSGKSKFTLPNLESFPSWKSKFTFPCLETLTIDRCDKMYIFSDGTISTPKLQLVFIRGREISNSEGLSGYMINFHIQETAAFLENDYAGALFDNGSEDPSGCAII